jgi:hypothetical protein
MVLPHMGRSRGMRLMRRRLDLDTRGFPAYQPAIGVTVVGVEPARVSEHAWGLEFVFACLFAA